MAGLRLSKRQWLEIERRYRSGERGAVLAAEYKIHRSTLTKRAAREGWAARHQVAHDLSTEAPDEP
jgi:hypothetical protein